MKLNFIFVRIDFTIDYYFCKFHEKNNESNFQPIVQKEGIYFVREEKKLFLVGMRLRYKNLIKLMISRLI